MARRVTRLTAVATAVAAISVGMAAAGSDASGANGPAKPLLLP